MKKEKVIRLNELDDLYNEFQEMGYEGEGFKEFVEQTKDDDYYVWEKAEETNLERVKNRDYENEDELEKAYRERREKDLNKSKEELNTFKKQKGVSPNETDLMKKIPLEFSYLKYLSREELVSRFLVLQKHYFVLDEINDKLKQKKVIK